MSKKYLPTKPSPASILDQADCEGFLQKRGVTNSSWKKRYFILCDNVLFYYKGVKDKAPLGSIIMPSYQVVFDEDHDEKFAFQIVHTNCRTFHLKASSASELTKWVNALEAAAALMPLKNVSTTNTNRVRGGTTDVVERANEQQRRAAMSRSVVSSWLDTELEKVGLEIPNVLSTVRDGVALCHSLEVATMVKAAGFAKVPSSTAEKEGNIAAALSLVATLPTPPPSEHIIPAAVVSGELKEADLIEWLYNVVQSVRSIEVKERAHTATLKFSKVATAQKDPNNPVESLRQQLLKEAAMKKKEARVYTLGLIGGECGKSCMALRFLKNVYVDVEDPTIEDNYEGEHVIDDQPIKFNIFDLSGSAEYRNLRLGSYPKFQGTLFCFSVQNRKSWEDLGSFLDEARDALGDAPLVGVVVGCMADRDDSRRVVSEIEARAFAELLEMPYVECSAKDKNGVTTVFEWGVHVVSEASGERLPSAPSSYDNMPAEEFLRLEDSDTVHYRSFKPGLFPDIYCATLEQIVAHMANPLFYDVEFVDALLMTYHSFTSAEDLLNALAARYKAAPTGEYRLPNAESVTDDAVANLIRVRVFRVLKRWVSAFNEDFKNSSLVRARLRDLVAVIGPDLGGYVDVISDELAALEAELASATVPKNDGSTVGNVVAGAAANPGTVVQMGGPEDEWGTWDAVDMDVVEAARNLTLVDYELFRRVRPRECLSVGWTGPQKDLVAPNISLVSKRFNAVAAWVTFEIVKRTKAAERAALIKKFIDTSHQLYRLGNYSGAMSLMSGLQCSPVRRLKRTWALLNTQYIQVFEELKEALSVRGQYANLRATLAASTDAAVPYLGIYLSDLTFIADGNENVVEGMINVFKRRAMAAVVCQITGLQGRQFADLAPIARYINLFAHVDGVDQDTAYALSCKVEPPTHAILDSSPGNSFTETEIVTNLRAAVPLLIEYATDVAALLEAAGGTAPPQPAELEILLGKLESSLDVGGSDGGGSVSASSRGRAAASRRSGGRGDGEAEESDDDDDDDVDELNSLLRPSGSSVASDGGLSGSTASSLAGSPATSRRASGLGVGAGGGGSPGGGSSSAASGGDDSGGADGGDDETRKIAAVKAKASRNNSPAPSKPLRKSVSGTSVNRYRSASGRGEAPTLPDGLTTPPGNRSRAGSNASAGENSGTGGGGAGPERKRSKLAVVFSRRRGERSNTASSLEGSDGPSSPASAAAASSAAAEADGDGASSTGGAGGSGVGGNSVSGAGTAAEGGSDGGAGGSGAGGAGGDAAAASHIVADKPKFSRPPKPSAGKPSTAGKKRPVPKSKNDA